MEENNIIREEIKNMPNGKVIDCITQGEDAFRENVYKLYLEEAEKRKIKIDFEGINDKNKKRQAAEKRKDILNAYFLVAIPFTGMFYFYVLSFRLLKHILKENVMEKRNLIHAIIQWAIGIQNGLLLIISIVGAIILFVKLIIIGS